MPRGSLIDSGQDSPPYFLAVDFPVRPVLLAAGSEIAPLAVDEPVSLTGLPSYQDVETAVTGHVLGEARLIGTYQR